MWTLRPYRSSDYAAFLELELETALLSMDGATDEERRALGERLPDQLRMFYGFSAATGPTRFGGRVSVLEVDERYGGHLFTIEDREVFTGAERLWVTSLAVIGALRGQGFGRVLIAHAEAEARARGIQRLALGVAESNARARRLYERTGFLTTRLVMERNLGAEGPGPTRQT